MEMSHSMSLQGESLSSQPSILGAGHQVHTVPCWQPGQTTAPITSSLGVSPGGASARAR